MTLPPPAQRASTPRYTSPAKNGIGRIRLSSGLLGLSSAAILAVYGLGYMQTSQLSGPNVTTLAGDVPTPTQSVAAAAPTPSSSTASSGAPATIAPTQVGYKDGTYVGNGTSRHGDIQATVVIKGGKIVSANVTRCQTRYPCSDVLPLVSEVVRIQSAPVHYVSGASDSSRAYRGAILDALSQAG